MNKKQTAGTTSARAAAISLLGVYSPRPGSENSAEFDLARQQLIYNLSDTIEAVEKLTLAEFRDLALRNAAPAVARPAAPTLGDFLDSRKGNVLLFANDGRRIRGTVEVQECTGRVRNVYRDEQGTIRYDLDGDDINSADCDYETKTDDSGRVYFEPETGPHVPETDVVLVSKSRVDEFLAAVAAQQNIATRS